MPIYTDIELKGPPSCQKIGPYNKFSIHSTITETLTASGKTEKEEGDRTLKYPKTLGLNPVWLHTRRAPVDQAVSEALKATIRSLHTPKFPYWGHLIDNSIKEFNASNPNRCRKLVYDLRHGEADHNAWKKRFTQKQWSKVKRNPPYSCINTRAYSAQDPERRKQPIVEYEGKEYCIIDPPLTAKGEQQAKDANAMFRQLKKHLFPMPKRAYVSPLLRAMQTFRYALGHAPEHADIIVRAEDSYIVNQLREQETGNSADILIDEYVSRTNSKKPRTPGTEKHEWYEEDEKKVRGRAARVHAEICEMDDSDCIVRVTHSLLIQNNLIRLAVGGGTVLQKFMLAEGGLFAYVIEGDRPDKKRAEDLRNDLKKVKARLNETGQRRLSAFRDPKPSSKPVHVTIERSILAV